MVVVAHAMPRSLMAPPPRASAKSRDQVAPLWGAYSGAALPNVPSQGGATCAALVADARRNGTPRGGTKGGEVYLDVHQRLER